MPGHGMRPGRPGTLDKLFYLLSVRERNSGLPGNRDDDRAGALAQLFAGDGVPFPSGDEDDSWWDSEGRLSFEGDVAAGGGRVRQDAGVPPQSCPNRPVDRAEEGQLTVDVLDPASISGCARGSFRARSLRFDSYGSCG